MRCGRDYASARVKVACPICNQTGLNESGKPCKHCVEGQFEIKECPRAMIGSDFTSAINLASISGGGDWPIAGGLLDQSAWFVMLKQHLESEVSSIEAERLQE